MWSWVVEMVRLENGHLSYRVSRLPFTRYSMELFVVGLMLFWSIALLQRRSISREPEVEDRPGVSALR
jgi:hypothetical protein